MKLAILGLPSCYEVEQLARMFFPGAELLPPAAPRGQEQALVLVRAGQRQLLVGVRQNGQSRWQRAPRGEAETLAYAICQLLYGLLCTHTGQRLPWGMLTGVRPVRLLHDGRATGRSEPELHALFCEHYQCTEERYRLALEIADRQRPYLQKAKPRDYSLYIGIPFCPSRCSYCSFVSRNIGRDAALVQPYVDALCRELEATRAEADACRLNCKSLYIGGGTPTSLSAGQLRQLLGKVAQLYDLSALEEYTVEAGRPDCTDAEKLQVLKEFGATRISINPQTFSDEVLRRIGRQHTAQAILDCYAQARAAGHTLINMDLIAGLPGDTVEGFVASVRQTLALAPENITVHTLTLKRASSLVIDGDGTEYADVKQMLDCAGELLREAGYRPYYLYRQKGTLQNLENIGWCRPGTECAYNIYIMEEIHSILSAGAGGSTKLRAPGCAKIERIFNYKYPQEYLERFDTVLERKKGVSEFYGRYLDSETFG